MFCVLVLIIVPKDEQKNPERTDNTVLRRLVSKGVSRIRKLFNISCLIKKEFEAKKGIDQVTYVSKNNFFLYKFNSKKNKYCL